MPITRHGLLFACVLAAASSSLSVDAAMQITIGLANGQRLMAADGLPGHAMGGFPSRHNPNRVRAQNYQLRVLLNPRKNASATHLHGQPFGITLNGVVFDPGTAGTWRIEALDSERNLGLDANHAHVQPTGAYHCHGLPTGLLKNRQHTQPTLLGYAAG